MAYDAAGLSLRDPTDPAWALAWARRFAGDRAEPELHADDEWRAELEADAVRVTEAGETTLYYRPQETAARVVAADPAWSSFEWLGDARAEMRSPPALAAAIREAGRWVDALIGAQLAARPGAEVVWPGAAPAPRAAF